MENKNTRKLTVFLVFLFCISAFFTFIEQLIDLEFYNNLASYFFIKTIYLGKRKK